MRRDFQIVEVIEELRKCNLLPAIVFRTSRSQCDVDVERCGRSKSMRLSPVEQEDLRETVKEIIKRYELDLDLIVSHPHYESLIHGGVGAHHAGQLLMWRLLLEELMAAGVLRVLVATGTVAAGVDFPARTVVITAHSKRGSDGFKTLTSAEFQQMSGRAGRRGRDTVGFCLAAPAPFCDARALLRLSKRPPEPLESSYFPSPSTVLNLLRYRNADDLRYTVGRSLAAFIDRRNARELETEADQMRLDCSSELRTYIDQALVQINADQKSGELEEEVFSRSISKEEKKILKRIRRNYREARDLRTKQMMLLDLTLGGLQQLGYLEGLSLSPKGYWAANLCTTLVLELAELIDTRVIHVSSVENLVAIVASIAADPYRSYMETKHNILGDKDLDAIAGVISSVSKANVPGSLPLRDPSVTAAQTVIAWLHTETWHEFRSILVLSGVAEGDAARLITQTAEQLNQITRLSETHSELSLLAEKGRRLLLRPPLTEAINVEVV